MIGISVVVIYCNLLLIGRFVSRHNTTLLQNSHYFHDTNSSSWNFSAAWRGHLFFFILTLFTLKKEINGSLRTKIQARNHTTWSQSWVTRTVQISCTCMPWLLHFLILYQTSFPKRITQIYKYTNQYTHWSIRSNSYNKKHKPLNCLSRQNMHYLK